MEWNIPDNITYMDNFSVLWDFPPLELPKDSRIALITLYSITASLAILGNILVIVVLVFGHRSKTEIRKYLLNLAISDLAMAIFCIPFSFTRTMMGKWMFGAVMCPTVLFIQITSLGVSIFTNTAIGCDRYMAVIHPIKSRMTKSRPGVVVSCIWIAATALASPQLFVSRTMDLFPYQAVDCGERWTHKSRLIYTLTILVVTYLIPLILLVFAYRKVCFALWKTFEYSGDDNANCRFHDKMRIHSRRKVVKMLITLVAVFAFCWFPLNLLNLVIDLDPGLFSFQTMDQERVLIAIFYSCHWLAMASCFANPLIYSFLNESFRADGFNLLRRCCPAYRALSIASSMRTSSVRKLILRTEKIKTSPLKEQNNKAKFLSKNLEKIDENEVRALQSPELGQGAPAEALLSNK